MIGFLLSGAAGWQALLRAALHAKLNAHMVGCVCHNFCLQTPTPRSNNHSQRLCELLCGSTATQAVLRLVLLQCRGLRNGISVLGMWECAGKGWGGGDLAVR